MSTNKNSSFHKRRHLPLRWRLPRHWRRIMPALLLAPIAFVAVFIGLVWLGVFAHMPGQSELRDIRHQQASSLYSADGQLLGRYYLQNRERVELDEITPDFVDALLAIEDIRYYEHSGLDYRALARVIVRSLLLRTDAGGGSTLTQQLAKNLYPRKGFSRFSIAVDKVREIIIARRIERLYSKQEILELYVNSVSFGEDTWGIKTASERFFNTSPARLQLHQAATLAGMLRATTFYNPMRNPDNALQRRNLVLRQMERYGMIDPEVVETARGRPLDLDYNRVSRSEGSAPHFREHVRIHLQQTLNNRPALDGNHYNLYTDGLTIETTLDSRVQAAAEHAVRTTLSGFQKTFDHHRGHDPVFDEEDPMVYRAWGESARYQTMKQRGLSDEQISLALDEPADMELFTWEGLKAVTASPRDSIRHYLSFLNAGFLAMHPSSGDIVAWVGSIDHRYFQYDHVRARRPTGSAFKPVVYAAALESGMKPCDYRRNLLSTYTSYNEWTPSNLQDDYGGHYSLQGALSHSVNTIAVELLRERGVDEVRRIARRMGIDSRIPALPSIALGTAEMSLLEMTRAYSTFVNRGVPATPRFLEAIYNADGELIYEFSVPGQQIPVGGSMTTVATTSPNPSRSSPISRPPSPEPAFSEETAAAMVSMLSKAVGDGSAGDMRRRFGIQHAVAGKTGTTPNYTDGWFMGVTPDLVFGSWVGGASPQVRMPESIGYGSQNALPVAGTFLQELGRRSGPEFKQIPGQFHPYQRTSAFVTDCQDYRQERFTDRVRDFFTGRDSGQAQIVDDEEEEKSLRKRIRGFFRRN